MIRLFILLLCMFSCMFLLSACESDDSASNLPDEIDYATLDWCWGGISAKNAQLVETCQIGNLHCTSSGLSYKWVSGGCEDIGAANRSDSSCLACLFVKQNNSWKGGKIDWISSSRTTRDFVNPNSGYHGWDPTAIANASEFAFVIIKGNKRSNIIHFKR